MQQSQFLVYLEQPIRALAREGATRQFVQSYGSLLLAQQRIIENRTSFTLIEGLTHAVFVGLQVVLHSREGGWALEEHQLSMAKNTC